MLDSEDKDRSQNETHCRVLYKNLVALPDIQNSSDTSIRDQFDKQLSVNNITQITRDDLSIERKSGGIRLSVEFSAKKPFLGRMSLCLDFQSAAHSGGGD